MPVIVGAPRSGTTLLRFMLDAHPDLAIPPETGFLCLPFTCPENQLREVMWHTLTHWPAEAPNWPDFGISEQDLRAEFARCEPFSITSGLRAFYRLYTARQGKHRWGDKTPAHAWCLDTISQRLPECHVIHLIRDGRDVALSLRPLWFSPGRDMITLATQWRDWITAARKQSGALPHYLEIRYEKLVAEPERVLREICSYLRLPFAPQMLDYHERTPNRLKEHGTRFHADGSLLVSQEKRLAQQNLTTHPPELSRIQAWKRDMTQDEQRQFESIAGELLRKLGYETLAD